MLQVGAKEVEKGEQRALFVTFGPSRGRVGGGGGGRVEGGGCGG